MDNKAAIDFAARSARLAEAAILGDRDAFGALLAHWHPRLLAFARRKAGADGEDVLQAAAVTIATDLQRLRDPKRFGPWAMTIIARRAADKIDGEVRERQRRDALALEPETAPSDTQNRLATRDALRKALAELPSDQRTLLTLHHIDGMTGPEIARLLGLPTGTVKSRLHTARAKLREAYKTQNTPIQKGDHHG